MLSFSAPTSSAQTSLPSPPAARPLPSTGDSRQNLRDHLASGTSDDDRKALCAFDFVLREGMLEQLPKMIPPVRSWSEFDSVRQLRQGVLHLAKTTLPQLFDHRTGSEESSSSRMQFANHCLRCVDAVDQQTFKRANTWLKTWAPEPARLAAKYLAWPNTFYKHSLPGDNIAAIAAADEAGLIRRHQNCWAIIGLHPHIKTKIEGNTGVASGKFMDHILPVAVVLARPDKAFWLDMVIGAENAKPLDANRFTPLCDVDSGGSIAVKRTSLSRREHISVFKTWIVPTP